MNTFFFSLSLQFIVALTTAIVDYALWLASRFVMLLLLLLLFSFLLLVHPTSYSFRDLIWFGWVFVGVFASVSLFSFRNVFIIYGIFGSSKPKMIVVERTMG